MSQTTTEAPTRSRFEVYPSADEPDRRTRYAWRLVTAAGESCLTSGTRFTTKSDARLDASAVQAAASQAPIEDVAT